MAVTDAEWQASEDPWALLRHVPATISQRKRLLLTCAAWQQVRDLLTHEQSQRAFEKLVAFAHADKATDEQEIDWTTIQIEEPIWPKVWDESGRFQAVWDSDTAALAITIMVSVCTATGPVDARALEHTEQEAQRAEDKVRREGAELLRAWMRHKALLSDCIRDIVANPFRAAPALSASVLTWNDAAVPRIAQTIYDECAFDRLPILADALQEAGCQDSELLQHCRSGALHVRGCWAVGRILGKE